MAQLLLAWLNYLALKDSAANYYPKQKIKKPTTHRDLSHFFASFTDDWLCPFHLTYSSFDISV